ncbi:MAG TPA: hypothetical protein VGR11_02425 [Solirubrobacteraceae bacterium]|nr:hypothetical protein [Solirubrobacteraceae bacterium]
MSPYAPKITTERIYIDTSEYAIIGTMTLPEVQRVSDALNSSERSFLALTDVVAVSKTSGKVASHSFLAVGLPHVVMAFSLSDAGALDDEENPTGLAARVPGRPEAQPELSGRDLAQMPGLGR